MNCELNGFKTHQIEMTGIGRVRVPMLVCHPFELGRVAVAGADVLGLQVLQLAVDVVPLAHDLKFKFSWREKQIWKKRFCFCLERKLF